MVFQSDMNYFSFCISSSGEIETQIKGDFEHIDEMDVLDLHDLNAAAGESIEELLTLSFTHGIRLRECGCDIAEHANRDVFGQRRNHNHDRDTKAMQIGGETAHIGGVDAVGVGAMCNE